MRDGATTRRRFDPSSALITLRGKGGPSDYLEVRTRVIWFRAEHPEGQIDVELIELDRAPGQEFALFKATARTGNGGASVDYGSETKADFGDYIEKASTKAVGRALAGLGYGTAAARDFDTVDADGYEHPVDSPAKASAQRPVQRDPVWEQRKAEAAQGMRQAADQLQQQPATESQVRFARALFHQVEIEQPEEALAFIKQHGGREAKLAELTRAEIGRVINALQDRKRQPAQVPADED